MVDTDWIIGGAKAAVFSAGHLGERVHLSTVAKLTKTQIVLADGGRYRRTTLEEVGDRDSWRAVLVRPDDERVIALRARAALRKLAAKVTELAGSTKGGPAEVLATLEQISQAVQSTTEAVTRVARS